MSLPYFPLYADRYEADTTHLSMLEDGAYNRLLRLCWRSPGCKLPNDLPWIFRQCRAITDADKAAVEAVLSEFFTKGRGGYSSRFIANCIEQHRKSQPRPWVPMPVQRSVRDRDGEACRYCGDKEGPFHLDHIHPWARGGLHTVENLVVSCASCNWVKGARTLEEMGWHLG